MLDGRWTVTTLSGDMGPRAGFGHLARCHDLLICTAELLQMALTSPEEEEHVELTGEGHGQEEKDMHLGYFHQPQGTHWNQGVGSFCGSGGLPVHKTPADTLVETGRAIV